MMKTVAKTVEPADRQAKFDHIRPLYLDALTLVERLHRRLLDVIKDEFDRRGRSDINSVQALLLYNIGDKELTAGELRTRGYYLGSNVSYNLKKLVEMGFLDHQRSRVDRRSVRIRLTDSGREIRDIVESLYQKHVRTVEQVGGISADEFSTLNKSLHRLERFWTDQNSVSALVRDPEKWERFSERITHKTIIRSGQDRAASRRVTQAASAAGQSKLSRLPPTPTLAAIQAPGPHQPGAFLAFVTKSPGATRTRCRIALI